MSVQSRTTIRLSSSVRSIHTTLSARSTPPPKINSPLAAGFAPVDPTRKRAGLSDLIPIPKSGKVNLGLGTREQYGVSGGDVYWETVADSRQKPSRTAAQQQRREATLNTKNRPEANKPSDDFFAETAPSTSQPSRKARVSPEGLSMEDIETTAIQSSKPKTEKRTKASGSKPKASPSQQKSRGEMAQRFEKPRSKPMSGTDRAIQPLNAKKAEAQVIDQSPAAMFGTGSLLMPVLRGARDAENGWSIREKGLVGAEGE
jgi:hypothetical protein